MHVPRLDGLCDLFLSGQGQSGDVVADDPLADQVGALGDDYLLIH